MKGIDFQGKTGKEKAAMMRDIRAQQLAQEPDSHRERVAARRARVEAKRQSRKDKKNG